MTALALEHFYRRGVDIAVIETGLGGRLDATNVLSPVLTITTDISHDHMEILGHSLRKIAREKAGIIKPRIPHLTGLLPREAADVITLLCRKRKAPLHRLYRNNFHFQKQSFRFDFQMNGWRMSSLESGLVGRHQIQNSALVLRAVEILRKRGFHITDRSVRTGLRSTNWPGRFEVRSRKGSPTIILDVAHNAAGAKAIAETFRYQFPGCRASVVIGLVKRKEHQRIIDALSGFASAFHLVPLKTKRSADLTSLAKSIDWDDIPVLCWKSLGAAMRQVTKESSPDDIIVIVGSHYLVGEYLRRNSK